MKKDTFRTALRAAGALTGIGVVACTSRPTTPAPPKVDCVALTDKAFGVEDKYIYPTPPPPANLDPAVVRCCNDAMATANGPEVFARHRWACCDVKTVEPNPASMCIPWGPPVPPRMARRGSLRRSRTPRP